MRRKPIQRVLMGLGLAALLTVGVSVSGAASAGLPAQAQSYRGQVREVKIDQCGLESGTCTGSLVLAQARGQEVDLAIPAGTPIQRGNERVHLEELGVGNYVMVQAVPLSRQTSDLAGFGLEEPSQIGDRVGTSAGERPYTLRESSDN